MDQTTQTIVALGIRHFLTGLAGSLVTLGLLQLGDKASFVQIGTSILVAAAGLLWSWWQKRGQAALKGEIDYWKSKARATAPPVGTVITGGKL